MVERLAKHCADTQYGQWGGYKKHPEAFKDNARWWLNAIADELDGEATRIVDEKTNVGRVVEAYEWQTKAAFLRNEAKGAGDE